MSNLWINSINNTAQSSASCVSWLTTLNDSENTQQALNSHCVLIIGTRNMDYRHNNIVQWWGGMGDFSLKFLKH